MRCLRNRRQCWLRKYAGYHFGSPFFLSFSHNSGAGTFRRGVLFRVRFCHGHFTSLPAFLPLLILDTRPHILTAIAQTRMH